LDSFSDKLNQFWRDTLLNLSELFPIKDEEEYNITNILSQPIWPHFRIKGIHAVRTEFFFILKFVNIRCFILIAVEIFHKNIIRK
jgi:hypothetical protein